MALKPLPRLPRMLIVGNVVGSDTAFHWGREAVLASPA